MLRVCFKQLHKIGAEFTEILSIFIQVGGEIYFLTFEFLLVLQCEARICTKVEKEKRSCHPERSQKIVIPSEVEKLSSQAKSKGCHPERSRRKEFRAKPRNTPQHREIVLGLYTLKIN